MGTPPSASYHGIFNHLSPATIARGIERLRRLDLFSAEDYERRHGETLDGHDAHDHAFRFGMFEQRQIFDPIRLARLFATPSAGVALPVAADSGPRAAPLGAIAVYVSTHGNLFMQEIAADLVRDLSSLGLQIDLRDETSSRNARPPISIYVAPHEFFILGDGWEWVRDEVLQSAVMLSTEQLQTGWFAKSLPLLLMSSGVIDMSGQTVACLEKLAMPALHLVPGVEPYTAPLRERDHEHPLYRVLPPESQRPPDAATPFRERPIDITFFGSDSPRRHRFFAQHAATLADYRNVIYFRSLAKGPVRNAGDDSALTRLASHVCGHAKITLNIHRSELGYFEWHRMVRLGMAAGSLVVSDPCPVHGDFEPGTHYLEESPRQIPNLLDWLLRSEEGRAEAERVRRNALDLLARRFLPAQAARPVAEFLARLARS